MREACLVRRVQSGEVQVVHRRRRGCPSGRSIDFRELDQTMGNVMSQMNSATSVLLTLATNYDCIDGSTKRESLRLVFTELSDSGVPTHKAMDGNFILCLCNYLGN